MRSALRLRHQSDFALLRAEGQTCQTRLCVLSYRPNGLEHNRYGFIVVRHLGKAARRNRIRRVMREAVRLRHPSLKAGFDMVFIARSPIDSATFKEVDAAIVDALRCARILTRD